MTDRTPEDGTDDDSVVELDLGLGGDGDPDPTEDGEPVPDPASAMDAAGVPVADTGEGGGDAEGVPLDVGVDPLERARERAGFDDEDDDRVEPVELLVQLAEEGEIDPWDIDIVDVTDAFLDRLDETDLRTSGRALFYASVLLRMKGDALLSEDDPEEEPEPEPWEAALEGGGRVGGPMAGGEEAAANGGFDPVDQLEAEMDRRLERKRARGTPETLDELVRDLREAERGSWWKSSRTYDTSESPRGYDRGTQTLDYRPADDVRREGEPAEADVTGTTHREEMDETIATVRTALDDHYDAGRDEVLFAEVRSVGGDAVQTFLALLFLAHRGHVHLQQDDMYGDLWIQQPATAAASDEAIAD
jgi:segregation and condensation protein A